LKKLYWGAYLKIKHLLISISHFKELHLMDEVYHKDKRCFIYNAVKSDDYGNRLYDIVEKETNKNGMKKYCVKADELKKIHSVSTINNSLFYHYKWWMSNWYSIVLRQLLGE